MNITKKRVEESATRFIREFEENCIRRLERLTQLDDFNFAHELDCMAKDYYRYVGSLYGVQSLFDYGSSDYLCVQSYIDAILGMSSKFDDALLELSRTQRQRKLEEPVFAPTTTATEIVLIASDTPNQDGALIQVAIENEYPARNCDYCGQKYIPSVAFGDNDGTGLVLTSYCSDECWHAHKSGQKKQIPEAA